MPGASLCSACLHLSALVPSPVTSGTNISLIIVSASQSCYTHATRYMLQLTLHTYNSVTADSTNLRSKIFERQGQRNSSAGKGARPYADNRSSIPGPHMVEELTSHIALRPPHTHGGTFTLTHIHMPSHKISKKVIN